MKEGEEGDAWDLEQQDESGFGWEELMDEGLEKKPNGRRTEWEGYYDQKVVEGEENETGRG